MKKITYISILSLFALIFISCEYDNYDEPSVLFNGKLTTTSGETFYFDGNPSRGALTVIQKGFGKVDQGTGIKISEDGSFSQLLFPGEYWLTLANNQYPFEVKGFESLGSGIGYDSIYMNLNANVTRTFEVIPYFLITDFTLKEEGGSIVANVKVKVNPELGKTPPRVARVRLFVGTASIVNSATTLSKSKIMSITQEGEVELKASIAADYRTMYVNNYRDYAFCRIALELNGISNYYLFSETKKIENLTE